MSSRPAAVTSPSSVTNVAPLSGDSHDKPAARLKPEAVCDGGVSRRQKLLMGHPWVFDHEIQNISDLGRWSPGTLVDVVGSDGELFAVCSGHKSEPGNPSSLMYERRDERTRDIVGDEATGLFGAPCS